MLSWQIFAIASAIFAALTAILGKIGVSELNANLATLIRTLVIILMTAGIVTVRGEWQRPAEVSSRSLLFIILSGIATGLSWLCYYRALQLGPASKVAPIDKLSLALTIVMAIVFLGEPLTWQTLVGGLLIVSGTLVLAFA